jgi:hypothetical protein
MTNDAAVEEFEELKERIEALNKKASQMLLFLSFAIVAAATVNTEKLPADPVLVRSAIRWWLGAVFPVLFGVLPLKEVQWNSKGWYKFVRWAKVGAMWVAVLLSGWGAVRFFRALWDP